LICESTSLKKYLDKSSNIFFLFGSEIILKNDSVNQINSFLKEKDFTEKKIISENDYNNINKIILENSSGTLFGSKTIIEINHYKGKIPNNILGIFEIKDIDKKANIAIIIKSSIEKINKATSWVKKINNSSLMIECNKLKPFEEKAWVKNQLNFMSDSDAKNYSNKIIDIFSGNLVAQKNEINILKLSYSNEGTVNNLSSENADFLPYQLEDKIIELDTKYSLRIINSIKKNDAHYGPLLVWIIGKIINVCIGTNQDKMTLEKLGVWKNKIPNYLTFIKKHPLKKMISLQKKIYQLDLASKGLAGISKDQFWQELDNMVIALTSN
tara:strand:- start:98 stop:1075 length:978 start_codon:yes stop_codon:yes gene_type:complete